MLFICLFGRPADCTIDTCTFFTFYWQVDAVCSKVLRWYRVVFMFLSFTPMELFKHSVPPYGIYTCKTHEFEIVKHRLFSGVIVESCTDGFIEHLKHESGPVTLFEIMICLLVTRHKTVYRKMIRGTDAGRGWVWKSGSTVLSASLLDPLWIKLLVREKKTFASLHSTDATCTQL